MRLRYYFLHLDGAPTRLLNSAITLFLGITAGMIVGCIMIGCAPKKPARAASYVIPKECAKVQLLEDLAIDKNGKALGHPKFKVTSTCTKVNQ